MTLGWTLCRKCGRRVNFDDGPDCPRCGNPYPEDSPIEVVPEHPVGAGDPELGTGKPGPELAAAQIEIRNLERVVEHMTTNMADAQRVILEQQTEIAKLTTQLTHALADPADLPEPPAAASPEESGL